MSKYFSEGIFFVFILKKKIKLKISLKASKVHFIIFSAHSRSPRHQATRKSPRNNFFFTLVAFN
jgi:hypothetical protein